MNLRQANKFILSSLSGVSNNLSIEVTEILSHTLNIETNTIPTLSLELLLSDTQEQALRRLVTQRLQHKPLALLVGHTDFMGHKIRTCDNVLIPRIETEGLTEKILADLETYPSDKINILEVGCGSGCITKTIIHKLISNEVNFTYIAIDSSLDAINCTKINLSNEIELLSSNKDYSPLISIQNVSLIKIMNNPLPETNILISNPPYLTSLEMQQLDQSVKNYEPDLALSGGNDGLSIYRQIKSLCSQLDVKPKVYLEIGPAISDEVATLFGEIYKEVVIEEDSFKRDRYCTCRP